MIKDFVINKVRTFQAKAGSMFGQKEAEALWKENAWKLALEVSELKELQDGWAKFIVNGDNSELNNAVDAAASRIMGK